MISTDVRTAKVKQWKVQAEQRHDHRAYAKLCFYFPRSGEQYRFACWIQLVRYDESDSELQELLLDCWKESPPSLRVDLELPTPGIPADTENSKGDDLQRTSMHINHQMMILHRVRILL